MFLKVVILIQTTLLILLITHARIRSNRIIIHNNHYKRLINTAINNFIRSHTQNDILLAYEDVLLSYKNIDIVLHIFNDDIYELCYSLNLDVDHLKTVIVNINCKRRYYFDKLSNDGNRIFDVKGGKDDFSLIVH
jgi:hypothetical protein